LTDRESCLKITETRMDGGSRVVLRWNAKAGKTYRINRRPDLRQLGYETVATAIPGIEPTTGYTNVVNGAEAPRFFYWVELAQ